MDDLNLIIDCILKPMPFFITAGIIVGVIYLIVNKIKKEGN
jgi:hypothetical protein